MKRPSKPPTRRESAQAIEVFAPHGWFVPESVTKALNRKVHVGPRKHPEQDLQITCVAYARALPATLVWSTPNHIWLGSGDRGKQAGYIALQKRMGMNPGATDLNILFRNVHGAMTLCLPELKCGSNKADEQQSLFMDMANGMGAITGIIKSLEDLMAMLRLGGHPAVR